MPISVQMPVTNHLLAALPRKECQRLLSQLEPVQFAYGQVLYEPTDPILQVYFPIDCLVSLLTEVDQHRTLEVGMVGNGCRSAVLNGATSGQ